MTKIFTWFTTHTTVHGARRIVLSAGLVGLAFLAFRLSFDAQAALATASGIDAELAWMYPILVDGFIVIAYLVDLWTENPTRWQRIYPWVALGVFTAVSTAGNAFHVTVLPPGAVTVEPLVFGLPWLGTITIDVAVLVNTVPAVALFVAIHLGASGLLRPRSTAPAADVTRAESSAPEAVSGAPATVLRAVAPRVETPEPAMDELLQLRSEGLGVRAIAERVGRGKTWVSKRLREHDEEHATQQAV